MSNLENQLLLLKNIDGSVKPAFLVLTGQTGSDFTFYVRDDGQNGILRQSLLKESGRAASTLTKGETSFSCRVHVLRPLLHKDDFKREKNRWEGMSFFRKLRECKGEKVSSSPYAALRRELGVVHRKLDARKLTDEELTEIIEKMNHLMAGGFASAGFGDVLPKSEKDLLIGLNPATQAVLGNYLKFCSLFKDSIELTVSRLRVGRVLAALSYEGDCWSVSFRKQEMGIGYKPSTKEAGNLNTIEEICQTLYKEIFYAVSRSESMRRCVQHNGGCAAEGRDQKVRRPQSYGATLCEHSNTPLPELGGLVVIAGSTNSAKSLITRGLIHLYLENVLVGDPQSGANAPKATVKRRPHLLTFEDPIEKYFVAAPRTYADGHAPSGYAPDSLEGRIDYTPRQQGIDAPDLQTALYDALRQTPKVFFVGETRRNEDWRALIDFAGTGHLVITTAHAGSLIEAMHKILLATKARTPADRNEVASRILAVVQLKRTEVEGFEHCAVLVPSVWRRVPRGVNSLTAEGLASILPHSQSDEVNPYSCLGRKYFAEHLLKLAETAARGNGCRRPDANFAAALKEKVIDWDLKGV